MIGVGLAIEADEDFDEDLGIHMEFEAADSDGKVHSMLSLRPAHVLKADDRYRRFQVDLTLSRPG